MVVARLWSLLVVAAPVPALGGGFPLGLSVGKIASTLELASQQRSPAEMVNALREQAPDVAEIAAVVKQQAAGLNVADVAEQSPTAATQKEVMAGASATAKTSLTQALHSAGGALQQGASTVESAGAEDVEAALSQSGAGSLLDKDKAKTLHEGAQEPGSQEVAAALRGASSQTASLVNRTGSLLTSTATQRLPKVANALDRAGYEMADRLAQDQEEARLMGGQLPDASRKGINLLTVRYVLLLLLTVAMVAAVALVFTSGKLRQEGGRKGGLLSDSADAITYVS